MAEKEIEFDIINDTGKPQNFILEPWGDETVIPQGKAITIRAVGPAVEGPKGKLQMFIAGDNSITLYGWDGSVINTSIENQDIPKPQQ